jgi:hypothetical protein
MYLEALSSRLSGMRKTKVCLDIFFPFTGLGVVVGRPGYGIDSRTFERGFWLCNLITSSYRAQSFATLHPLILVPSWCFYSMFEVPKFAEIRVQTQKLSPFSFAQFSVGSKSGLPSRHRAMRQMVQN